MVPMVTLRYFEVPLYFFLSGTLRKDRECTGTMMNGIVDNELTTLYNGFDIIIVSIIIWFIHVLKILRLHHLVPWLTLGKASIRSMSNIISGR